MLEQEMLALWEGHIGSVPALTQLAGRATVLRREILGLHRQWVDDIFEIKASIAKLRELSRGPKAKGMRSR